MKWNQNKCKWYPVQRYNKTTNIGAQNKKQGQRRYSTLTSGFNSPVWSTPPLPHIRLTIKPAEVTPSHLGMAETDQLTGVITANGPVCLQWTGLLALFQVCLLYCTSQRFSACFKCHLAVEAALSPSVVCMLWFTVLNYFELFPSSPEGRELILSNPRCM